MSSYSYKSTKTVIFSVSLGCFILLIGYLNFRVDPKKIEIVADVPVLSERELQLYEILMPKIIGGLSAYNPVYIYSIDELDYGCLVTVGSYQLGYSVYYDGMLIVSPQPKMLISGKYIEFYKFNHDYELIESF